MKKIIIILFIIILSFWYLSNNQGKKSQQISDYKNIEYKINGEKIKLENGIAETKTDKNQKIITRYFGNDLKTDLNGDGREDVVFLITQEKPTSEILFYVVGALNTENGFIGTDGYFLGDRIAPQNINNSQNPRHKYVIVANYTDRKPDEKIDTPPSVGKSVYLKLDEKNMQWGIVVPDFEGESR